MGDWIYFIHPPRDDFAATMTDAEQAVWSVHFERLQRLTEEGVLVLAGPTLGPVNTGVCVFEAPDEAAARLIMDEDPVIAGGWARGELRPFRMSILRPARPASVEANQALVRSFFDAMNGGDQEDLDDLLAQDVVRHCEATPDVDVRNLEQFKAFMSGFGAVFPDFVQTITHLIADGDRVAVWAHCAGTQTGPMGPLPASGRKAEFDFGMVLRVADGKIAEWWVTWDNVALLTQLGHLPRRVTPAG